MSRIIQFGSSEANLGTCLLVRTTSTNRFKLLFYPLDIWKVEHLLPLNSRRGDRKKIVINHLTLSPSLLLNIHPPTIQPYTWAQVTPMSATLAVNVWHAPPSLQGIPGAIGSSHTKRQPNFCSLTFPQFGASYSCHIELFLGDVGEGCKTLKWKVCHMFFHLKWKGYSGYGERIPLLF